MEPSSELIPTTPEVTDITPEKEELDEKARKYFKECFDELTKIIEQIVCHFPKKQAALYFAKYQAFCQKTGDDPSLIEEHVTCFRKLFEAYRKDIISPYPENWLMRRNVIAKLADEIPELRGHLHLRLSQIYRQALKLRGMVGKEAEDSGDETNESDESTSEWYDLPSRFLLVLYSIFEWLASDRDYGKIEKQIRRLRIELCYEVKEVVHPVGQSVAGFDLKGIINQVSSMMLPMMENVLPQIQNTVGNFSRDDMQGMMKRYAEEGEDAESILKEVMGRVEGTIADDSAKGYFKEASQRFMPLISDMIKSDMGKRIDEIARTTGRKLTADDPMAKGKGKEEEPNLIDIPE